jgi:REP element-mobilizing transposase RayT
MPSKHDQEPLAYMLTWATYGTWLPGDRRGWVRYRHGFQDSDPRVEVEAAARMGETACRLNSRERRIVEETIAAHCGVRNWTLHAVNCRSNHVHVVVSAGVHPDMVCEQFKAWCSRELKKHQRAHASTDVAIRERWWAARGSKRYLKDEQSLEAAIIYVRDAQDAPRNAD